MYHHCERAAPFWRPWFFVFWGFCLQPPKLSLLTPYDSSEFKVKRERKHRFRFTIEQSAIKFRDCWTSQVDCDLSNQKKKKGKEVIQSEIALQQKSKIALQQDLRLQCF